MTEVLSKTTLYEGRLTAVRERIRLSNGHESNFETILHPGAVVILPRADSGKIVLIRQYRHAIGRTILELPAGTLEPGEAPELCARRELVEEIGCTARRWHAVGTLVPAPGFCNELQYCFVADGLIRGVAAPEPDEQIEIEEVSVSDLEQLIRSHELIDAKSLALFCRAKLCGLL